MGRINVNKPQSFFKGSSKINEKLSLSVEKFLNKTHKLSEKISSTINLFLKDLNITEYKTYNQSFTVYTQYTSHMNLPQSAPPQFQQSNVSQEQMRYNQLKASNVLISNLESNPEDYKLVTTSLQKNLTLRGFSPQQAKNITHSILNNSKIPRLGEAEHIATTINNGATSPSRFSQDESVQWNYKRIMGSNIPFYALNQYPHDMKLAHDALQSLLIGKGFSLDDSFDLLNNMLRASSNETLAQIEHRVLYENTGPAEEAPPPPRMDRMKALKELDLPANSSDQEINKAYKKLALKYHPDKTSFLSTEALKKLLSLPESDKSSKDKLLAITNNRSRIIIEARNALIL